MYYMIFDLDKVYGIQFFDLNYDYNIYGFYRRVEGEYVKNKLVNLNEEVVLIVRFVLINNFDQFEMVFKISEFFGFFYILCFR